MNDPTENIRRVLTATINSEQAERAALEAKYGQVWDTTEVQCDFTVNGFMAPFISIVRKSDGVKGTLVFQHSPRFYWGFEPS